MTELGVALQEHLRKAGIDWSGDLLREGVMLLLRLLMECEVGRQIGAERYERHVGLEDAQSHVTWDDRFIVAIRRVIRLPGGWIAPMPCGVTVGWKVPPAPGSAVIWPASTQTASLAEARRPRSISIGGPTPRGNSTRWPAATAKQLQAGLSCATSPDSPIGSSLMTCRRPLSWSTSGRTIRAPLADSLGGPYLAHLLCSGPKPVCLGCAVGCSNAAKWCADPGPGLGDPSDTILARTETGVLASLSYGYGRRRRCPRWQCICV